MVNLPENTEWTEGVKCNFTSVFLAIAPALICVASVLNMIANGPTVSATSAQHLIMAKLLMSGSRLYQDIHFPGTPTIVWIDLAPAFFASAFGIKIVFLAPLFVLIASLASIVACAMLLNCSKTGNKVYLISALTLMLALVNNVFILQLGEEQHWLILLSVPFLLVRWLRTSGIFISNPAAIASGIAAGIGLSLNILFPFAWVAFETGLFIKDFKADWKRPEVFACLGALCVVPVYFLIDFEAGKVFVHEICPLLVLNYISEIDSVMTYMNCAPDHNPFLYFSIGIFIIALSLRDKLPLFSPLLYLSLTGLAIYIYAKQGFTGQIILHVSAAMLLAGAILAYFEERLLERTLRFSAAVKIRISTAMLVIPVCIFIYFWNSWAESKTAIFKAAYLPENIDSAQPMVSQVLRLTKQGDRILFINDTPEPGCSITLLTDRQPVPPLLWYFPLHFANDLSFKDTDELNRVFAAAPVLNSFRASIQRVIKDGSAKLIFIQDGRASEYMMRIAGEQLEKRYEFKGFVEEPEPKQEPLYVSGPQHDFRVFLRRETFDE